MDPESLLAQARAGDEKARNDLLAWCRPFMRAQLKRALPDCPDEASELTNDAQMKMYKGFSGFRGEAIGQFKVWARVITEHVLSDFFRRRRPKLAPLPAEPRCPRPEVLDQLVRAEDKAADFFWVAGALEELPEHYRKVIEARLFDGLLPHEIAERLGWPQVRVRVYSKRAVKLLATQLRGKS
jgi:RNA polymerase sigma factor (sigma-70 family)